MVNASLAISTIAAIVAFIAYAWANGASALVFAARASLPSLLIGIVASIGVGGGVYYLFNLLFSGPQKPDA